jgi:hypothetical protein
VPAVVGLKVSQKSASELLAKPSSGTKFERAKEIIREHLADGHRHPVEPIWTALEAPDISRSIGERASRELSVEHSKDEGVPANAAVHYWRLPGPFIRRDRTDDGTDEGSGGRNGSTAL